MHGIVLKLNDLLNKKIKAETSPKIHTGHIQDFVLQGIWTLKLDLEVIHRKTEEV